MNFFERFFSAIHLGAQHVLAAVAGLETSVHQIEASNPLVAAGAQIALSSFPALSAVPQLETAVLSVAQAISAVTAAASPQLAAQSGQPAAQLGAATPAVAS
jgi:hypothetical protein